jgi:hypothetical protein
MAVLGGTLVVCENSAAATPVSPAPGAALTTSHPLFRWALGPGEDVDTIYIANRSATTTEGRFFDENVVDLGFPSLNSERRVMTWRPSSPLYAGAYWWIVSWDNTEFNLFYSKPSAFRIKPVLTQLPLRLQRFHFIRNLSVTVRWRANVRVLTVRAMLLRRGRAVWGIRKRESNFIGTVGSDFLSWYAPRRIPRGTRLTLRVSIINGVTRTRALAVKAP